MPAIGPIHRRSTPSAREQGFTLVEILVVIIIMLILSATLIISFRGTKDVARQKETLATAAAYDQAFAQYQADNANNLPDRANKSLWYIPANKTQRGGPLNLVGKPYVRNLPEGVGDGVIGVSNFGHNCGTTKTKTMRNATTQTGWVSYCAADGSLAAPTAPYYSIRVATRHDSGSTWDDSKSTLCWLGNFQARADMPRCK